MSFHRTEIGTQTAKNRARYLTNPLCSTNFRRFDDLKFDFNRRGQGQGFSKKLPKVESIVYRQYEMKAHMDHMVGLKSPSKTVYVSDLIIADLFSLILYLSESGQSCISVKVGCVLIMNIGI